jgi:hypothetical protein
MDWSRAVWLLLVLVLVLDSSVVYYCIAACVLMADMVIGIGLSMAQHHITKLAITVKTKHRGGQN